MAGTAAPRSQVRSAAPEFDPEQARQDFPILARTVHGRPLVYLDNAATTQKPAVVIEAEADVYRRYNANVHRAIHALGEEATAAYEDARRTVAALIGSPDPGECVFVRNATEALNLVAWAWARRRLRPGDEVLLTPMEHHSNLVPWQLVAAETGASLRFIPLRPDGNLDLEALDRDGLLTERTRVVAFTQASNVLGTLPPVAEICRRARDVGAVTVVDAAQGVPHLPVDVRALGCDFLAFSGHKLYGPLGIGVLWGRRRLLEDTEPFLGGGEMILRVELTCSTWNEIPYRFEAGTPNVAGAVGLAAAVDYVRGLGLEAIAAHEADLTAYALERMRELPGVTIYGPPMPRGPLVTFNLEDVHPHDLAQFLDQEGVAVRAGHHCAQPLMRHLGVAATARASFALYSTRAEVDALCAAILRAGAFFHG
jgi:cysteine desulfurase/selenocysteine lyase